MTSSEEFTRDCESISQRKILNVNTPNMSQRRTLLPVTASKTSETQKRCQHPNLSYHDLSTNTICWHLHLPIFIGSPRRSAGSSLAATIFSGRAWSGVSCCQQNTQRGRDPPVVSQTPMVHGVFKVLSQQLASRCKQAHKPWGIMCPAGSRDSKREDKLPLDVGWDDALPPW